MLNVNEILNRDITENVIGRWFQYKGIYNYVFGIEGEKTYVAKADFVHADVVYTSVLYESHFTLQPATAATKRWLTEYRIVDPYVKVGDRYRRTIPVGKHEGEMVCVEILPNGTALFSYEDLPRTVESLHYWTKL